MFLPLTVYRRHVDNEHIQGQPDCMYLCHLQELEKSAIGVFIHM